MPWSTPFYEPITLGRGKLVTLQHAADYIMKLPEDVQRDERWQIAVANLIHAAETGGGWLMFARIAVLRAFNPDKSALRGLVPQPSPSPPPKSSRPVRARRR